MGRIVNAFGWLRNVASSGFAGLQTVGVAALGAVATGAVVAGAAILGFAADGVGAAMSMEVALSNIAANLGATKEEVAPLGDLIADLGLDPNLKVTADEAALAINNLVTNGLNMTQIMEGAAEATVLLANSTGADFGTAANIATDSMAIFNIEADQMMEAVNGITSVTVASKFGINDYALALAQGGGVASAVGVEFEDFNTAIAAISPLFASGSDAGTSFKTLLTNLVPSSNSAEDAMRELGIITADGTNQFFDAQGNMREMAEIAGVLEGALSGLSEEQQNEALKTIFGSDAMRAAVGLFRTGEEGFRQLQETMGETDAMESAATRMDNLAGVLEIIGGVIDTVKLQVGQAFLPVLRLLADNLLGLANNVGPAVVGFFEGIAAAISGIVPVFQNMVTAVQSGGMGVLLTVFEDGSSYLSVFLQALGMTEEAANSLATGFLNLVTQVGAFLAPIVTAVGQFVSWQDVLIGLGVVIASVVIPVLGSIVAAIAPVIAVGALLIGGIALLRHAWEENWGGIQEKTQAVIDFVVPLLTNAITTVQTWWSQNGDSILLKAGEIWTAVQLAIQTVVTTVMTIISTALALIQGWWQAHGDSVMSLVNASMTNISTIISTVLTTIQTLITTVLTAVQTFWSAHGDTIMTVAQNTWEGIKNWINTALENISILIDAFALAVEGDWEGFGERLRDAANNAWEAIKTAVSIGVENVKTLIIGLIETAVNLFYGTDWGALGRDILDGIVSGLSEGTTRIANKLTEIADAAMAAWDSFWGNSSPSRLMMESAGFITGGVEVGWERSFGGLISTVADSGQQLADAFFAPVAAQMGEFSAPRMNAPTASTRSETNHYWQLEANYQYQDERSLRDDIRLLQMLSGA